MIKKESHKNCNWQGDNKRGFTVKVLQTPETNLLFLYLFLVGFKMTCQIERGSKHWTSPVFKWWIAVSYSKGLLFRSPFKYWTLFRSSFEYQTKFSQKI